MPGPSKPERLSAKFLPELSCTTTSETQIESTVPQDAWARFTVPQESCPLVPKEHRFMSGVTLPWACVGDEGVVSLGLLQRAVLTSQWAEMQLSFMAAPCRVGRCLQGKSSSKSSFIHQTQRQLKSKQKQVGLHPTKKLPHHEEGNHQQDEKAAYGMGEKICKSHFW